ncbi:hypothetical protein ACEQ8H_004870 [Pleosporales sp. CAS-2024a]
MASRSSRYTTDMKLGPGILPPCHAVERNITNDLRSARTARKRISGAPSPESNLSDTSHDQPLPQPGARSRANQAKHPPLHPASSTSCPDPSPTSDTDSEAAHEATLAHLIHLHLQRTPSPRAAPAVVPLDPSRRQNHPDVRATRDLIRGMRAEQVVLRAEARLYKNDIRNLEERRVASVECGDDEDAEKRLDMYASAVGDLSLAAWKKVLRAVRE